MGSLRWRLERLEAEAVPFYKTLLLPGGGTVRYTPKDALDAMIRDTPGGQRAAGAVPGGGHGGVDGGALPGARREQGRWVGCGGRLLKLEREMETELVVVEHEDGTTSRFREDEVIDAFMHQMDGGRRHHDGGTPGPPLPLHRGAQDRDELGGPHEYGRDVSGDPARRGRSNPWPQRTPGDPR